MSSNEGNDWELCKENIQPLKKGRKLSVLTDALDKSKHAKLNMQKMEFEKQIRTYLGEDPLQVWYEYVLWVEQNYPMGGKEGNSIKLIESCFTFIKEKCALDKYRNDERYLDLWIKYADHCPNPVEVYSMLHSQSLFINFPALYENWSYQYEKYGNMKKANEIYSLGLEQHGLQQRHQLETSFKHFQMRVAKFTAENLNSEGDVAESLEDVRELGNILKIKDAKKNVKAPIVRVGLSVIGRGANIDSGNIEGNNSAMPNYEIFQDENKRPVKTDVGAIRVPSIDMRGTENEQKPSKWTKLKSRPHESLPVSSLPDIKSLNFPVYADPEVEKDRRMKPIVSGALAERKVERAWKMPIFSGEPIEEKCKSMYCKSRVYCGTEEFSLEELRAMDYFLKLKLDHEKNDNITLSGNESNTVAATTEPVCYQDQPIFMVEPFDPTKQPQYCKHKVYANNEEFSLEEIRAWKYFEDEARKEEDNKLKNEIENLKDMVVQQQEVINKLIKEKEESELSAQNISSNLGAAAIDEPAGIIPPCRTKLKIVQTQPAYEDSWIAINKSVAEPNETNLLDESTKGLLMMAASEPAMLPPELKLETTGTILSTPLRSRMEKSGNVSLKEVQPSPTINTKFANNLVAELFNRTLSTSVYTKECESAEEYVDIQPPEDEPFEIYHDEVPPKPKAIPFTIYQDENVPIINRAATKTARKPFMILTECSVKSPTKDESPIKIDDEDKENGGLVGIPKVKRSLSGILMPSQDIPIDEPEELAIPLEPEANNPTIFKFEKPAPREDFTIRLPSSGRDFAKMAAIASTPNPWSFGLVPQTDLNDDFTMKAPAIVISKPQSCDSGLDSKMSNLKLQPPALNATKMDTDSENPRIPIADEASKLSVISSYNLTKPVSPCAPNASMVLPKHSSVPESEAKKSEDQHNDSFDPDKVAAMLWDMDPVFDEETSAFNTDQQDILELLSSRVSYPEIINPFCKDLKALLLYNLKEPLKNRGGFVAMSTKFPAMRANSELVLNKEKYHIRYLRGKGNYAQIYQAFTENPMNVTMFDASDNEIENSGCQMALKVQTPACYWEFYICHEIRKRLTQKNESSGVIAAIMRINRAYFFNQGSIFATDYHVRGSLLDLTNAYKMAGKSVSQAVAFYVVIELMAILDAIHSCGIIHGDLKPDNVLLQRLPSECGFTDEYLSTDGPFLLKVIDFGRGIDLKLLPKGTTFTKKVSTNGFTCCEMKDGRPWTYQTDYYGLAAIAHCLLWGSYMNVKKREDKWMLVGVVMQRHWNKELWNDFFDQLLNVESCQTLVDLKVLRNRFIIDFNQNYSLSSINDNAFVIG